MCSHKLLLPCRQVVYKIGVAPRRELPRQTQELLASCCSQWGGSSMYRIMITMAPIPQIHPNSPFTVNSLILWDSTATLSQHWKDVQPWRNSFDKVLGTCGMQPSIWASNVGAEEAAGARNLEIWATFGGSNNLNDLGDDKTSWILYFTNDRLDSTKCRQWGYYDSCVWVLIGLEVPENQSHMFAAHSTQMLCIYMIIYTYIIESSFSSSSNSLMPTVRWNRARARDLSLYMVNLSRFSTQAFARKVQRCWAGIGDIIWWHPTYGSIPPRQWIFSNFCATAWGFGWLRDSCESSKRNMPVTEGNRWTRFQDDTSFVWSSLLITYIHIINTYTILYRQVIWRRAACCYAYSHDRAFSWIGYIHSTSW